MISTVELERVAARGWRGTSTARLGQWLSRAGSGFTGRANSVLPLGSPGCPVDVALDVIARFYASHRLVPLFQVPVDAETAVVDGDLTDRCWETFNRSWMLVPDLGAALAACPPADGRRTAEFADRASAAWLAGYQYRGAPLPSTAVAVLAYTENVVFGSFPDPAGGAAAVGRRVYLQVAAENTAALALYDRLAFSRHHAYHYRRPASSG